MSKSIKLLLGAALSFLFCFLMIGYAALTDTLIVKGNASVSVPEGLYITSMTLESESNMDKESHSFVSYSTTVEALGNRTNASRPNQRRAGSVTYLITVMNNTKHEYAYRGLYYQTSVSGYNGNGSIATKAADNKISIVSSLDSASAQERIVAPDGGTLTFRVTYTYGKSVDVVVTLFISLSMRIASLKRSVSSSSVSPQIVSSSLVSISFIGNTTLSEVQISQRLAGGNLFQPSHTRRNREASCKW